MLAALIRINSDIPDSFWYADRMHREFWCCSDCQLNGDREWVVLPGQGIPEGHVIFPEHGTVVRENHITLKVRIEEHE